MVQKFCPSCQDWIPVACKTCPCGHKFVKTTTDKGKSKFEIEALSAASSRHENGRPKRTSAMNSLYYHSALHVSSFKLARQAVAASARKRAPRTARRSKASTSSESSSQPATTSTDMTDSPGKMTQRKGRPPKSAKTFVDELPTQSKKPEIAPNLRLRNRLPVVEYSENSSSNYSGAGELSAADHKTKTSCSKPVSETESYRKLYKTLSDSDRLRFSIILKEINKKFLRNSNFPL